MLMWLPQNGWCMVRLISTWWLVPLKCWVIADESANPKYIAADLLSQAEHDVLASAVLLTTSETLAREGR